MTADVLLVLTTCADPGQAATLAQALVADRLAACVSSIEGVRSTYRWQGAIERSTETMLVIKTTEARYAALEARIKEMTGYELPEILAVRSEGGLPAYLDWVGREVEIPNDGG